MILCGEEYIPFVFTELISKAYFPRIKETKPENLKEMTYISKVKCLESPWLLFWGVFAISLFEWNWTFLVNTALWLLLPSATTGEGSLAWPGLLLVAPGRWGWWHWRWQRWWRWWLWRWQLQGSNMFILEIGKFHFRSARTSCATSVWLHLIYIL